MFALKIAAQLVVCSKFFSAADRDSVLTVIPEGTRRVVFIDTPATVELAPTIEALLERGIEVHVRDHHDEPNPANPRAEQIKAAAQRIRDLVGGNAIISDRERNPACSSLMTAGEFLGEGTVLVIDPDPDGLTAGMKGLGITYPELDADAAVLDGPRAAQTAETLSPNALLLVRAMSGLPAFDAARPEISEKAKAQLFSDFVAIVQGDESARAKLEKNALTYEEGVKEAERLAALVTDILPGVAHIDVTSSPRFDMGTLATKMEARPGCKVTVQRKSQGPIAGKHGGIQISMAVAKAHQATVNLQELLPSGFTSSPEAGIISNTTFLLHVSETVWNETVLPALRARFNPPAEWCPCQGGMPGDGHTNLDGQPCPNG
jgi:hypothetical protein